MFYIQLIAILGFAVYVLSFYRKDMKTIIIYQVVSNFAYTVHYFLLGALPGAFTSFVGIFRNIAFLKVKKHKNILAAIVISIYVLITIIFYENFSSLFPMIANSTYLLVMLKDNKKYLVLAAIFSSVLWLSYSIFVESYSCMITESILIVSNTIQLIKINKKSR